MLQLAIFVVGETYTKLHEVIRCEILLVAANQYQVLRILH